MKNSSILAITCGVASVAGTLRAEDVLVSIPVPKGTETLAAVGDLDADGCRDFAVHEAGVGVIVRSGRYGHVLRTIAFHSAGSSVYVADAGDLDGDAIRDIAVGDPASKSSPVTVFSGAEGTLLFALATPAGLEGADFGHRVRGIGDTDADGVDDLVVTSPKELGDSGRARVYSGASGALRYTLSPQFPGATFGHDATPLGDVNGDRIPDFAVSSLREVKVIDGATGATHRVHAGSLADQFGFAICGVGDANFDGVPDLAVGAPLAGMGLFGRVSVFSGANGVMISDTSGGAGPGSRFGFSIAPLDPLPNGIARVVVGAPGGDNGVGQTLGMVLTWEISLNQGVAAVGVTPGDGTGRVVASVGDSNGDGISDAIVSRLVDVGGLSQRVVELVSPESLGVVSNTIEVPLGTGGAQRLSIDGMAIIPTIYQPVEEVAAGRPYVILGSASGTAPGFSLGVNHHVPLVFDAYFMQTATTLGANHVIGGLGVLDAEGNATATVIVPPLDFPALVGLVLHHAAIVFEGPGLGGVVRGVSNAAPLRLAP